MIKTRIPRIIQTRAHFRLGGSEGQTAKSLEIILRSLHHAPKSHKIASLRRASNAAAPRPFDPRGQ